MPDTVTREIERAIGEDGPEVYIPHARPLSVLPRANHLVARIKRSSKYWGQTAPNEWFDVEIVEGDHYCVTGAGNRYRLLDVAIGIKVWRSGTVIDLTKGAR